MGVLWVEEVHFEALPHQEVHLGQILQVEFLKFLKFFDGWYGFRGEWESFRAHAIARTHARGEWANFGLNGKVFRRSRANVHVFGGGWAIFGSFLEET